MRRRDVLIGAAGLSAPARALAAPAPLRGVWRDDEGKPFAIGRFPEFGEGSFAFDYAEMRIAPLSGREQVWRMASTLDGTGAPVADIVLRGALLRIGERGLRSLEIRRVPLSATSEGAILSGELALPDSSRPRGVVVMVYGSGPAPKEAFDPWAFWFLASNFAVVAYDKRGSGRSGGDWRLSGLETLAGDARAVIEAARQLGPAGPLFAWGASQAGWILPQLGAAGLVDGLIVHAGSAMHPRDQILAAVEAELAAYGFARTEIERAKAYYALDTDVSCGLRAWSEIDVAHREAQAGGAEWILAPPAAPDAPQRTMIRLMADFDPAPYWRANRAPTLALFGGKDLIVPAEANRRLFETMVSTDADFTALTLPAANHLMLVAQSGVRAEYGALSHIDPGYFPAISNWLASRS